MENKDTNKEQNTSAKDQKPADTSKPLTDKPAKRKLPGQKDKPRGRKPRIAAAQKSVIKTDGQAPKNQNSPQQLKIKPTKEQSSENPKDKRTPASPVPAAKAVAPKNSETKQEAHTPAKSTPNKQNYSPQTNKKLLHEQSVGTPTAPKAPSRPDPIAKTARPKTRREKPKEQNKSKVQAPKASLSSSPATPEEKHGYKLLINADEPEECRVALLEQGKLESFHIETVVSVKTKGNIYKGKVVTVEANLQAAFVDIGTGKNAFLPFSEIHPEYYAHEKDQDKHWKDLNIREVIKEGQELLIEVVKEATGNKGANMTTFLSLPGRYVVLMPGSSSKGISRKIENEAQRKSLREMLLSCKIPEGVGYIIRTASNDITKTALTKDVRFLSNLWQEIKERGQTQSAPSLVYQEQNIIARFLRDHFSPEIQEILVDSEDAYKQVVNFLELLPAAQRKKTTAKLHKGPRPLLNSFNVEKQIEQIYHPTVKLPSGGSIVISPTEALVAVDVNSGRTDKESNFEKTIFQANMEAAEELARQLRLRDLGGLIVVDFIDMRVAAHTREVEKMLKNSMKKDKAKIDFTRISKFGLMQISRQRMGAPVEAGNYVACQHCQGRGMVKSVETQSLVYLRQIQTGVTRRHVNTVQCLLPADIGKYLLNKKRAELAELEKRYNTSILIETEANLSPSQASITFLKE